MKSNMSIVNKQLKTILVILNNMVVQMASIQDVIAAATAEQNLVKAAIDAINTLVAEVKQLLAAEDVSGAQDLLDQIAANSTALGAAITSAAPAPAPEPAPTPVEPAPVEPAA